MTLMRKNDTFASKIAWTDLDDFDPERHMGVMQDFMQNELWPKVGKSLRDPVGHTAFAADDLRGKFLCAV